MFSNVLLLIFALAFMGCVLATPFVTKFAIWLGAVDRPDQFRRVHKGTTPRMGGLGLLIGLALAGLGVAAGGYLTEFADFHDLWKQGGIVLAALITVLVGVVDDSRGVRPRMKLFGQTLAVIALYLGGVQITKIAILGRLFDLSTPGFTFVIYDHPIAIALPSFLLTLLWFLGCMNVWNLIDGMDGLASGVGLLVTGTLMLVAIHQGTVGPAFMAAALAGSLAGFLLYNWHPACIFLGDTGSLLIGLMIGVIGVQGSLKGTSTVSIMFPLLAMGLPISDTAMAIFRRWVRNLPLSAADRRDVHHLVMGLGLDPRQAAAVLYCFSAFLCGAVLLGVSLDSEVLAIILGVSGCLAFLLVLTSRRDELKTLRSDFLARMTRKRQERQASKVTWEAIQRIELCSDVRKIWEIVRDASRQLGCDHLRLICHRQGRLMFEESSGGWIGQNPGSFELSGPTASFRLKSAQDLIVSVTLHQALDSEIAADIAFRFLQRLSLATSERMDRLFALEPAVEEIEEIDSAAVAESAVLDEEPVVASLLEPSGSLANLDGAAVASGRSKPLFDWFRIALGWEDHRVSPTHATLGKE